MKSDVDHWKKMFVNRWVPAFRVGMATGFIEMRTHKLRSFLSLLGVMLGVAALVAMLTIVGGVDDFMKREMGRFAGRVGLSNAHRPEELSEKLAWSRSPGFRFSDLDFLESLSQVARTFKVINEGVRMRIGRKKTRLRIAGTNKDNLDNETNFVLTQGRVFNDQEYESGNLVCVISWMVDKYLRDADPQGKETSQLGKSFRLKGKRFRIIGVFDTKSKQFGKRHTRHMVYVPLKAVQQHITGYNPNPHFSMVELKYTDDIEHQISVVGEKLARHHRSVEDFNFHLFEFIQEFMNMIRNVRILFTIIAVASLAVGGLGIMNVMLSSLSERIHEIGVRKTLGATSRQVLVQFLAETVTLSTTGGLVGAAVGSSLIWFGETIYEASGDLIRPQLGSLHVILVVCVVVLLGVVFGLYPAVKASRLNPVDALRYE